MLEDTGAEAYERQQRAIIGRMDLRAALEADRRAHAGAGRGWRCVTPPALAEEISEIIPGARLAVIPGAGHLTLEQPEAVTAEMEAWLRA